MSDRYQDELFTPPAGNQAQAEVGKREEFEQDPNHAMTQEYVRLLRITRVVLTRKELTTLAYGLGVNINEALD